MHFDAIIVAAFHFVEVHQVHVQTPQKYIVGKYSLAKRGLHKPFAFTNKTLAGRAVFRLAQLARKAG